VTGGIAHAPGPTVAAITAEHPAVAAGPAGGAGAARISAVPAGTD
jgi:hypothetical protein